MKVTPPYPSIAVWRPLLLVLLMAFACPVFAQLPSFDLDVIKTDETCAGNGTLTCNAFNTQPGATVVYRVYKLPDTTTAIAVLASTNFLGGLIAGDYRVIATQTLGPDSSSETFDITIENQIVALAYTLSGTAVTCGTNGTMTVHVFAGTAVSYEIISGPVTAPLQSSEVFTGLSAGEYQVRVFDNCGQGWVTTHTLFAGDATTLNWAETSQSTLVDCNQITLTNSLSPDVNGAISYPVTVVYTVHPPDGSPDIVTTTYMASGDISQQEFTMVIPYYSNQVYSYNVTITDACGNGFYFDNIGISKPFRADLRTPAADCGQKYITFELQNYMPPVTVQFTDYPTGFDLLTFNPNHPGPFNSRTIDYGSSTQAVPWGHYAATITDGCGRSISVDDDIEFIPPQLNIEFEPGAGCASDHSLVKIKSEGYKFVSVIITSGPPEWSPTYPVDVSALIDPTLGNIEIPNMPTGHYTVTVVDNCGNIYNDDFDVPPLTTSLSTIMWPGCETGRGSVRIRGNSVSLVSVELIDAPPTYAVALPQDVSFNISPDFPDTFSMNGFEPGTYTFKTLDSCGLSHTIYVVVEGYTITQNSYDIIPHCGSFDLEFHFTSNVSSTFWLQKLDPATGQWVHPQTNAPYVDGTTPNDTNSYRILNNDGINYNISYLGTFRILHRFQSFDNGAVGLFRTCIDEIQQFTFLNLLTITDIRKATCNGVNSDVAVFADGVPPFHYQITTKDGQPFFVDNGTNNTFTALQPAIYNFLVYDSCGNISNQLTDVALLPSLVQIHTPGDLVECDTDGDGKADFNLAAQTAAVLGGSTASDFSVTYYLSETDALTASNPLPDTYATGTREIFVRMQYNAVPTCFDVTSFDVTANLFPDLDMPLSYPMCSGQNVTITADAGFDSYSWSTGETEPTITVTNPGTYTLTVTLTQNGITCTRSFDVTVAAGIPPSIHHIVTTDWTADQNTISVALDQGGGQFEYSLDNEHFQSNATFYGLEPGIYTVYVRDVNGCEGNTVQVYLLAYPKYFTPNGDSYHDFWQVDYASAEPGLQVYIFDRYGKLLTGFGSDAIGWDGRYNGREMPSTDYWFLVIRQDGREHRGHFAMKR